MKPHSPEVQEQRFRKWNERFDDFDSVLQREYEKFVAKTRLSPNLQQLKEEVFPRTKFGDTQNYEMYRHFYYLASKGFHSKFQITNKIYVQAKS